MHQHRRSWLTRGSCVFLALHCPVEAAGNMLAVLYKFLLRSTNDKEPFFSTAPPCPACGSEPPQLWVLVIPAQHFSVLIVSTQYTRVPIIPARQNLNNIKNDQDCVCLPLILEQDICLRKLTRENLCSTKTNIMPRILPSRFSAQFRQFRWIHRIIFIFFKAFMWSPSNAIILAPRGPNWQR